MEQAKNDNSGNSKALSSKAQYTGLGSFTFFAASLVYFSLVSLGSQFQDLTSLLVAIAALAYFAGLKLHNYSFVSGAWISLGIVFVSSWIMVLGAPGNIFSIFAWSAALLAGYELNRFAFAVLLKDVVVAGLDIPSARKYENLIRNHAASTVAIILASTCASLLVVILTSNSLIIGIQPELGVAFFAFLVLIVAFTLVSFRAIELVEPEPG